MSHDSAAPSASPISRRTAVRAGIAAGAAVTAAAAPGLAAAQGSAPMAMRAEHLEVLFVPTDAVSIVRAGDGPPQRGDFFYVDAPIYAVGDVNGAQIGTYQCFGAWTAAGTATEAPNQRLTTVQYMFADGAIMGLINEAGTPAPTDHVGAVQGGTGRYAMALGTFQQLTEHAPEEGAMATAVAPGTPGPAQLVVRAVFDLMLPESG